MKKIKKRKKQRLTSKVLSVFLVICIIYLIISVSLLIPYGIEWLSDKYIIEPDDLPNYSDIFNSVFTVLNIIITSFLSYTLYKLNREQTNNTYNKEISGPSLLIYYTLKFAILSSTISALNEDESGLEDEEIVLQDENDLEKEVAQKGKELIANFKVPKLKYKKELKEHIPYIIGNIEDEDLRNSLFEVFVSIYENQSSNSNLIYLLSDNLVKYDLNNNKHELVEKRSRVWIGILFDMYNKDNWVYLKEEYRELMQLLRELGTYKN